MSDTEVGTAPPLAGTSGARGLGIAPAPEGLRALGGVDLGLLWGNLGVSLLVVVAGAVLVPTLSLPDALVAIAIAIALATRCGGARPSPTNASA